MITLDASAAIKLIIHEENSDIAARLFFTATETGEPIVAPDILLPETMNVLWKHLVLLKDISSAQFDIAVDNFKLIWDSLVVISTNSVLKDSIMISKEQKISFYDAVYAAISISEGAPLFTFDKNIIDNLEGLKVSTTNHLENFRLHEAAQEIYQYIWHEFADIYVEESKKQMTDEKLVENTKKILIRVLINSVKLLHPFMPFITEELWSKFCEAKLIYEDPLIMVSKWPTPHK